jgi:hypothetical protein
MKNKNLILLGVAAVAGYFLLKKAQASGGMGEGDGNVYAPYDVTATPPAPATPTAPLNTKAGPAFELSAPVISAQTQAAIDAGQLNIFGLPQQTTAPKAPFTVQYEAKQAKSESRGLGSNIANPLNVVYDAIPILDYQAQAINSAIKSAPKKATVSQDVANRLDPGLASALGLTQTVSKASSSSKSTPAAATVAKTAPPPAPSGNYVYSRAQATSFAAMNQKKKVVG